MRGRVPPSDNSGGEPGAAARGGLLLLCAWLGLWQPLNFAAAAVGAVRALPVRGWPLALLLVARLAVTALGLAAARSVWDRRPGALVLVRWAIALSGLLQLLVYATAIAPNNRLPGDTPYYVALTVLVHGGWLLYLARAAHVRRMFD